MKSILTSIAATGLLATMAAAQSYHGRGLPLHLEGRASNGPASPGNRLLVYVITIGFEFGAIDLGSGAFLPIGPGLPANVGDSLITGPRTSLLSLGFEGSLVAIDPATGKTSVVGPTGLGDCSTPASPCGPNSANCIGYFDGKYYATDFAQNLYSVNPDTGRGQTDRPHRDSAAHALPLSARMRTGYRSMFSVRPCSAHKASCTRTFLPWR